VRSLRVLIVATSRISTGKHALGDRARKLDQGILITRFELPFNIWCLNCNAHIGMGVRYNAEKKKIGNYYSTPIFSFRCKCHLCDGWFEIQTDPKNTRYVVVSGAKQKNEEWDPEENGGFAIHDSAKAGPSDPLAALEKTAEAVKYSAAVQAPRIESLQSLSDRYSADPYSHSMRMRKKFRIQKKIDKAQQAADDAVKSKYGLPETLGLVPDSEVAAEAKEGWVKGRQGLEATAKPHERSSKSQRSSLSLLRATVLKNSVHSSRLSTKHEHIHD